LYAEHQQVFLCQQLALVLVSTIAASIATSWDCSCCLVVQVQQQINGKQQQQQQQQQAEREKQQELQQRQTYQQRIKLSGKIPGGYQAKL
jgi:hypothetical protein